MALDTYTNLKSAIQVWLDRVDLTADADDLIDMFEAWCNRNLRVPQMEQEATSPAKEYMQLPSDFLQMRDVQWQGSPRIQLQYVTPSQADEFSSAGIPGTPLYYTIVGDQLRLVAPPSTDTDIRMDYWKQIPALAPANGSNWLLRLYPDAYLYGPLVHGNVRIINPNFAATVASAWQQIVGEIMNAGKSANYGSILVMRPQ